MTAAAFLLLAFGLTAAFVDWSAVHLQRKRLEYVAKPATLALFVASALALDPADDTVRTWFVVALAFSLLGDVFLMLAEKYFVLGLGSFLIGHVAYVAGMLIDGVELARMGPGIVLVAICATVIGRRVLRSVQAGDTPELFGPVAVYMTVISLMVVSAFGTGHWTAILGALAFYASDAMIAWNKFVRELRHGKVAIIVTYHLAQVGLLLSLV